MLEFEFVGYNDKIWVPCVWSVDFFPCLLEFFEGAVAFFFDVLGADVAESLLEFACDYDVSLGFAEPSVSDRIGFSELPGVFVGSSSLGFLSG